MSDFSARLEEARSRGGAFLVPEGIRLRLSGADALRYLNGQITRDLKNLRDHEALPACILTPKGKLCALLSIHRGGEGLIVESDAGVAESLPDRLGRYLVADEVEIIRETWPARIHCFGGEDAHVMGSGLQGFRVNRLGVPGNDVSFGGSPVPDLTDEAIVEILRIERGVPAWGKELTPETLPPEAGLDRTCIDFDRGCYPGQEVISRLKSIGRVNRLLHGFRGENVISGAAIISEEGREIGAITSAAELPGSGESVALGYLPRGTVASLFVRHPLTGSRHPISITGIFAS
jgi:folate-binding protein YgfZ